MLVEDCNALEKLLKPMKLPFNRKKDFTPAKLKWLKKNLGKLNESHRNFQEAMKVIDTLIEQG